MTAIAGNIVAASLGPNDPASDRSMTVQEWTVKDRSAQLSFEVLCLKLNVAVLQG